jgi:hypothetical protein
VLQIVLDNSYVANIDADKGELIGTLQISSSIILNICGHGLIALTHDFGEYCSLQVFDSNLTEISTHETIYGHYMFVTGSTNLVVLMGRSTDQSHDDYWNACVIDKNNLFLKMD